MFNTSSTPERPPVLHFLSHAPLSHHNHACSHPPHHPVSQPSGLQCDNGDVLVRRFFLYDVVTGLTAGSGQVPQVLRYASQISLSLAVVAGKPRQFLPPVLTLKVRRAPLSRPLSILI